jgi:drug/metabolite transporter (DMT)-like permease
MSNAALYVIAILIWGSTWLAIEFQLGVVAPEVSVLYRYTAAAALLFAWSALKGRQLRFDGRAHAWFAVLGLLLFSLNYVLAYRAQVHITSALCAIAFSMLLWMNIVNARLFFGIRSDRRVIVGAVLGMSGILVLFSPQIGEVTLSDSVFLGMVVATLGALSASFGNMASQHLQKLALPVVQTNAWGMLYGAVWTGIYVVFSGRELNFDWSAGYVISLLYLVVFGSIVAFGAYLTLVGRIGAHRAGYATVMFPVVALFLSYLFEGLVLDVPTVVGALLAIGGNVMVLRGHTRPSAARRAGSGSELKEAVAAE